MSADVTRIDEWLYDVFSSNETVYNTVGGRIYGEMAPQGSSFPLVLFAFLGGADKVITFSARFTNAIYLIRAVGRGSSFDSIEPLADRLDILLGNAVPTNGVVVRDIRIASCNREQPHQRKDFTDGVATVYLGGFYRIRYQPST